MVVGTKTDGKSPPTLIPWPRLTPTRRPIPGRNPATSHLGDRCRADPIARRQRLGLSQRASRQDVEKVWLWGRPETRRHHQRDSGRLQEGAPPKAPCETDTDCERGVLVLRRRLSRRGLFFCSLDRGGCGHVQAPSMSTHRHDREYLCVSAF